jgi:NitT/TauT family transport system ATP-binding protein
MTGGGVNAAAGRIEAIDVGIRLGAGPSAFDAVQNMSFTVEPHEFVCILGPSGCGKSTLLGALAGHLPVHHGHLAVDGSAVDGPHRDRGMVFQQHTLFEWKRVIDNVAFGPKMRGTAKAERLAAARDHLDLVGLAAHARKYPSQLSGGMQQRVEIARALINNPRILLMDEPFGALDAQTRLMMQELLLDVWERKRTTVVFVTHDIDEALFLGTRVLVMTAHPGRILEDIVLPFARPRHRDLVVTPEFVELKRRCISLLRARPGSLGRARLTPLGLPAAG